MSESVYGPLNSLKQAVLSGDKDNVFVCANNYINALDVDYYDNNGKWKSDEDTALKFLYGRMDSGVLCDELGCNAAQLESRAKQVAWGSIGEPFSEMHVRMIMTLHNKGASDQQISAIMGIDEPKRQYKTNAVKDKEMMDAVKMYEKQGDLLE